MTLLRGPRPRADYTDLLFSEPPSLVAFQPFWSLLSSQLCDYGVQCQRRVGDEHQVSIAPYGGRIFDDLNRLGDLRLGWNFMDGGKMLLSWEAGATGADQPTGFCCAGLD
jgi:hypothetical protein